MTEADASPFFLEFGALLDGLPDILQVLDLNGRILYTSPSCKIITGYQPHELVGHLLIDFIHPDDSTIFFKEYNESIKSSTLLRFSYRFRKADGRWIILELQGHLHSSQEAGTGLPHHVVDSSEFLLVARPYQTKTSTLFDSFLELKIENERLLKKIAELKHEAREDRAAQVRATLSVMQHSAFK
jgi:PAS domain S-box-containing protein